MSEIVVIGAGMGGMTAAARLATKGHRVTVLEQSGAAGGKVGRFQRDGFVFDTGPSLLTLPQVYRDFFNKTGRPIETAIDVVDVEPGFTYRWSDGSRTVMPGADSARCADALGDSLGGSAADDWRALMRRAARMWELTRRDFLEAPLRGIRPLARLSLNPSNVNTIAPLSSLRALGRRHLRDERLVTLLDRYATYTGSDPRRAPAALATIPYIEQTFGAHHVVGGIRALADAVFARCLERGVEFEFNTTVTRITRDGAGAVSGVITDNGRHRRADIVVANTDAGAVHADLLSTDDPGNASAGRVTRSRPASLSGFCIYAAVQGTTTSIAHHNVWFCDDYDDEFDSIFAVGRQRGAARLVPDPTIYACVPQDPHMHPGGAESWFILVNAAPQRPAAGTASTAGIAGRASVDWTAPGVAQAYADHILEVLARRGVDLRPRLLWREVRTPADIEAATLSPGGTIYGSASHGPRASFTRPANQTRVPGLYLVGGSSHPGGGLPLVAMSGAIVADLIGRATPAASTPGEH
ncbi:MAG: phytoene desaturase [Actinobacteria bacterium]|nr:phytoene desaturase [Actinomycetota bacterium]